MHRNGIKFIAVSVAAFLLLAAVSTTMAVAQTVVTQSTPAEPILLECKNYNGVTKCKTPDSPKDPASEPTSASSTTDQQEHSVPPR